MKIKNTNSNESIFWILAAAFTFPAMVMTIGALLMNYLVGEYNICYALIAISMSAAFFAIVFNFIKRAIYEGIRLSKTNN